MIKSVVLKRCLVLCSKRRELSSSSLIDVHLKDFLAFYYMWTWHHFYLILKVSFYDILVLSSTRMNVNIIIFHWSLLILLYIIKKENYKLSYILLHLVLKRCLVLSLKRRELSSSSLIDGNFNMLCSILL